MPTHLVCNRALPTAVRAWVPLEAPLTSLEDLLAAAVPITFGFVTSPHLSGVLAILEQSEDQKAFLAAALVLGTILTLAITCPQVISPEATPSPSGQVGAGQVNLPC